MNNKQIWLEGSQGIEELKFEKVDSSYIKLKKAYIVLGYLLLMAVSLFILTAESSYAVAILIAVESVLAVACIVNLSLTRKIYDFAGYALRDHDISYRRGIFFPTVTTVPFGKIQQVSVGMSLVSRIFKLYYVEVTNGSQGGLNQFSIPGLTKDRAENLKSFLISKTECGND